MFKSLLFLAALSPVFSDSFEANAATACLNANQLDLGDGKPNILLTGSICHASTAKSDPVVAKAQCQLDTKGECKRTGGVIPPPDPIDGRPTGYTYLGNYTWSDIFYGAPVYSSPSYLAPIGSVTARTRPYNSGKEIAGKIISVPFDAPPYPLEVKANGSQSIPAAGYSTMQALSTTMTVTKRKGDITIGPSVCGSRSSNPTVRLGPDVSDSKCRFVPGEKLWLNIAFPDGADPGNPNKNSCAKDNASGGTKCDRNFTVKYFAPN